MPSGGAPSSASVAASEQAWPAPATVTLQCRLKTALAFSLCKMMESLWSKVAALSWSEVSLPIAMECFLASSDQTRRACLSHPPPEASKITGTKLNPDY